MNYILFVLGLILSIYYRGKAQKTERGLIIWNFVFGFIPSFIWLIIFGIVWVIVWEYVLEIFGFYNTNGEIETAWYYFWGAHLVHTGLRSFFGALSYEGKSSFSGQMFTVASGMCPHCRSKIPRLATVCPKCTTKLSK